MLLPTRFGLGGHQRLRERFDHRLQHVRRRARDLLAQQVGRVRTLRCGHRTSLSFVGLSRLEGSAVAVSHLRNTPIRGSRTPPPGRSPGPEAASPPATPCEAVGSDSGIADSRPCSGTASTSLTGDEDQDVKAKPTTNLIDAYVWLASRSADQLPHLEMREAVEHQQGAGTGQEVEPEGGGLGRKPAPECLHLIGHPVAK